MASEDIHGDREAKKLRSSEPDVQVVLCSGDKEPIQWHHSQTLASKSKYIDAMLSTPMKEKDTLVISFPDITPDKWHKMMNFLDSPVAARQMNARDALGVAILYDKYEFVEGRKLCDQVMMDYFKVTDAKEKKYTLNLDLTVELVHAAHKANLESAFKEGITWMWKKLECTEKPYGRMMFTEEHLKRLVPLLKYSIDNHERMGLRSSVCSSSNLITHWQGGPELEHDDFPKEFIKKCERWEEWDLLRNCISHIEVSGSNCNADGNYTMDGGWYEYEPRGKRINNSRWAGQPITFRIHHWKDENFEGWAIIRRYPPTRFFDEEQDDPDLDSIVKKRCWIAPYSKNCKRPPLKGWISCDPLARGNPTIKIILNESIE